MLPDTAVACAIKELPSIDTVSELLDVSVVFTHMVTAASSKVLLTTPLLACPLTLANTGAVVPPMAAAVPVTAVVPLTAVAIAANRLLFAATELSFSTPTDSATRTESVSAVTVPVFVWLCAKP